VPVKCTVHSDSVVRCQLNVQYIATVSFGAS